jgi:hypothetical protein
MSDAYSCMNPPCQPDGNGIIELANPAGNELCGQTEFDVRYDAPRVTIALE